MLSTLPKVAPAGGEYPAALCYPFRDIRETWRIPDEEFV
jgi:hypothetical protein